MEVRPLPGSARRTSSTPTALAYAAFVPTGLISVLLGPLLPTLTAQWRLDDTHAGYLITAQFLGSLLGTVSSGPLARRIRFRWTMVLGLGMMAAGAATLMAGSYAWGMASVFCYGVGTGLTVPTTNLLVARAAGERRSAALNLLNFFWVAGAVACPFMLAGFERGGNLSWFLFSIAGCFGLIIAGLLALPNGMPELGPPTASAPEQSLSHVLIVPMALVLGAMFFLYVGTENAFGAWLASYAQRSSAAGGRAWITVPSYFYGALLVGRLLAPFTLRRIDDGTQARWGAALAAAGAAALLMTHTLLGIIASTVIIGLGLATLYPIAIGFMSSSFGEAAPAVASVLFALSTLGAAFLPWLVGYVSTLTGSLRTALLLPFGGCVAMLGLFATQRFRR